MFVLASICSMLKLLSPKILSTSIIILYTCIPRDEGREITSIREDHLTQIFSPSRARAELVRAIAGKWRNNKTEIKSRGHKGASSRGRSRESVARSGFSIIFAVYSRPGVDQPENDGKNSAVGVSSGEGPSPSRFSPPAGEEGARTPFFSPSLFAGLLPIKLKSI